tara:strand:+ start:117 stop:401 length:285 start_codon:yes stop_codon:yes gene_type:complete
MTCKEGVHNWNDSDGLVYCIDCDAVGEVGGRDVSHGDYTVAEQHQRVWTGEALVRAMKALRKADTMFLTMFGEGACEKSDGVMGEIYWASREND